MLRSRALGSDTFPNEFRFKAADENADDSQMEVWVKNFGLRNV